MFRWLLLANLACAAAVAQDPTVARGRVLERPSGTPIQGVNVRAESGASTFTDQDGAFALELAQRGTINLTFEKTGYQSLTQRVNVDTGRTVNIGLIRPASLTGRVVDESGAPRADVTVQLWMPRNERAVLELATNAEGVFIAPEVQPASFVARIVGAEPRVLDAPADGGVVEQLVRDSYWPGGVDTRERALPIVLAPGLTGDFGTLRAATAPHYRVRVRTPNADCDAAASLTIIRPTGAAVSRPVDCAREFVIAGLVAGAYSFGLYYDDRWAYAAMEVRREGQEVELKLGAMGRVSGRIVPADGASIEGLRDSIVAVALTPEPYGLPMFSPNTRADAAGRFEFEAVAWPLHTLLGPRGPGYYVAEVRTGREDHKVAITPGGVTNVEVVVDNRGATLMGTVPTGEHVVFLIGGTATITSNGQFEFRDLPPGEYRAVVVPRGASAVDPETLAPYATAVTLKRGEAKSIQLRPPSALR